MQINTKNILVIVGGIIVGMVVIWYLFWGVQRSVSPEEKRIPERSLEMGEEEIWENLPQETVQKKDSVVSKDTSLDVIEKELEATTIMEEDFSDIE